MIRIAICDDEPRAVEQIEEQVRAAAGSLEEQPFVIETYTSPVALRNEAAEGKIFHILLLDVEMPALTGLALAEELRSVLPSAAVIFLTSHTELHLAQESFKVGALRYVSKLNMEKDLPEALEAALRTCRDAGSAYYTLTHYRDVVRIPVDEILYVTRIARTLEIVTESSGVLHESRGLREMLDELNDERFLMIERGCFVNLDSVVQLSENEVVLKNGRRLPASRRLMPQIKEAILRIWGNSR